jgi:hypothetical protein
LFSIAENTSDDFSEIVGKSSPAKLTLTSDLHKLLKAFEHSRDYFHQDIIMTPITVLNESILEEA